MPDKTLVALKGNFPFKFVLDWYNYQSDHVNKLDVTQFSQPLYEETASFCEVIPYKCKNIISKSAKLTLYGNKLSVTSDNGVREFDFDSVLAVTVLGKNKLNIYHDSKIYQFKGNKRFNALKYVNIFNRYKNISKGDSNNAFLGL